MSKKQKVMEALLTSNVTLNSQEIMWIASHLPNEGDAEGEHKKVYTFDHTKEDLFKCMGVTEDQVLQTADIFGNATKKLLMNENYYISNAVEEILNKSYEVENFQALIVSKLLRESLDHLSEEQNIPRLLAQMIKSMKKRQDRDEED